MTVAPVIRRIWLSLAIACVACSCSTGRDTASTDTSEASSPPGSARSPAPDGAGAAPNVALAPGGVLGGAAEGIAGATPLDDTNPLPLAPGYVPPSGGRARLLFDADWRFLRADAENASAAGFDDSAWAPVSLPHTWNALDGQDGGSNYYRGTGWYRKHHVLPAEAAGKRVFLEFDGSNIVTDVFINGAAVGQHRGGFARFRFDVTGVLLPGSDNVIAVRVSNTAVTDVAPLNADFTFFGGLYRDVHLIVTEPVHIDLEDYASPGVYLDASNVSPASAELRARTRVRNDSDEPRGVTVTSVIVQPDGAVVGRLSATATLAPRATAELEARAILTNPHLWDGLRDAYLYSVHTELSSESAISDWITQPLGIRDFAVDASTGFSLNGNYLDLHGVNRHQDRLDKGWAIGESDHDEDMALMKEMGCTAVRLSHYQHGPYFYDVADRTGMILWSEVPLVNAINDSAAFTENAKQQLTELIRQNYNHPSIVFWGIGNEQRSDDAATNALLGELATLVASEDPGRLSTYAQCCTSDTGGLPQHTDTVGYNTYYGWYDAFGAKEQFAAWADGLHAARPTWKIGLSEYGAGGALFQHSEDVVQPQPYGLFHPEEWQNEVHETHWLALKARPFLWGKFVWNMFDFGVDNRNEGETPGRNDKGLVSYDRKTRKDAFYWYKANWSSEPVVYITSRRFTARMAASTTVKIYSNTESVELRVNGVSQGSLVNADHIFRWPGIALAPGANSIEAIGTQGTDVYRDNVTWTR